MNFTRAVQCSEDVPDQQPPSFQTGQAVSVSPGATGAASGATGAASGAAPLTSTNLQADAEKYNQQDSRATGTGHSDGTRDEIIITGGNSKIVAKGLAAAMKPGTVFQLGSENHMTVFHDKGGRTVEGRPSNIKPKYRLTESQARPDVKRHLDIISSGLATDWRRLGRRLGLSDPLLEQIRMDHERDGQHEVNYRMLTRWTQEFDRPTLEMLAKALAEIGRGDLADELSRG